MAKESTMRITNPEFQKLMEVHVGRCTRATSDPRDREGAARALTVALAYLDGWERARYLTSRLSRTSERPSKPVQRTVNA